jgi:DNA-binding NarL/FixJ family response regulator
VQQVVESGITGFLTKTCDKNEIIEAVQAVAAGKKMFCHKVLDIILENPVPNSQNCEPAILSVREIEIIRLIANGYTTRQIATTLYRSFHTISTHRKNIMKKLGINSTSDLLMYAMNTGLIQPREQITANH